MLKYTEDQIFILVDDNTHKYCLSHLLTLLLEKYGWRIRETNILKISAGEEYKTIDTVCELWHKLIQAKATRWTLLFNLGGGVVTDIGGFVAATYKRGIDYINVPTTLLAMIDASFGGKTGFDFDNFKNSVGAFYNPIDTWILPDFLKTLPVEEILSGYAELIKHALLSSENMYDEVLNNIALFTKLNNATKHELAKCERLILESIDVKNRIVKTDPNEQGIRKSLNLGHTIGHAIEELSFQKKIPMRHGYAVVFGLVAELYISTLVKNLDLKVIETLTKYVRTYYGKINFKQHECDMLVEYMRNDKKNLHSQEINFTLLSSIGKYDVDNVVTQSTIFKSLDFLNNI